MLRTTFGLIAIAALACSTSSSSTNNVDGGPLDAAVDAGFDGGSTDAGTDGGTPDAGAPTGQATLTGSTAGVQLNPMDAITFVDASAPNDAVVTVSDTAPTCFELQNSIARKNQSVLRLVLRNRDGSSNAVPLTAGTYQVTTSSTAAGLSATAAVATTDSSCAATVPANADSGTVTVTMANTSASGAIQASFTLQFGADTLTGTFSAPVCTTSSTTATSCL